MEKIYKNHQSFEKAAPEEEGVPSECILSFLSALYKYGVNMHSVLFFRNFKLIFDGYYKPFNENTLHRMFSVTKSFVSAAVGILAGREEIDLDSPVIKYFPEYDGDCNDRFVREATVRHLLEMRSPHEKTAFKQISDDDYVKSFFKLKASKVPGTAFSYDTSASHTLCALAEKISGKSLIDFLRDEFLRDLGFSDEAYCLRDPLGRSLGGSGLMARPLDIGIFAHVFLNGGKLWGKLGGKQVISGDYVKSAILKQSETVLKGGGREEWQGYGYQFWRTLNNGYMCYGIGGQLALILPDFNFVMVTTADTLELKGGVDIIFGLFWEKVYPYFSSKPLRVSEKSFSKLMEMKKSLEIKPLSFSSKFSGKNIAGKKFSVFENEFGIKDLFINFYGDFGKISFSCFKGDFELSFGVGRQVVSIFPYYGYKCAVSGDFLSESSLIIKCHVIDEEIGLVWFQIDVNDFGDGVFLTKKNIGIGFEEFNGCYMINANIFLPAF